MSDLKELKVIYDNCIKVQNEVISRKREKLNIAQKKRDYDEMRRIRQALNILYDEKTELEYLALSLEKYA